MLNCASHAVLSSSIFLAIAKQETKQAGGCMPRNSLMTPTETSQEDVDPAVMRRVAAGDVRAFECMYDAFSGLLYSLALRMLQRPEDAEELLQDAFAKMWREAVHYDPSRGAPLAWAITLTRHMAIDRIRSTTRRLHLHEAAGNESAINPPTAAPQPTFETEQGENARAVRESLATLSTEVREAIELAYFGGLSHSQIAEKLSLPLTTVKSRIRRAMMQLRQTLRHYA